MKKYKRAFILYHKSIKGNRNKRFVQDYWRDLWNKPTKPPITKYRKKRGLKGGSSSRAVGISVKSGSGQLNLRRGHKKFQESEDFDNFEFEEKKRLHKHKLRVPCEPLPSEPYVNIEVVKHGRDPNVSFSSGTIVKIACGKGYGSNLSANKTAKCVRGKWKPLKPSCYLCKRKPAVF